MLCCVLCCAPRTADHCPMSRREPSNAKQSNAKLKAKLNSTKPSKATQRKVAHVTKAGTCYGVLRFLLCSLFLLCCVIEQRKAESKAKLIQAKQSNTTQGGTCYESWHMLRCVAVSALLAVLCCVVSYCVVLGCAVSC